MNQSWIRRTTNNIDNGRTSVVCLTGVAVENNPEMLFANVGFFVLTGDDAGFFVTGVAGLVGIVLVDGVCDRLVIRGGVFVGSSVCEAVDSGSSVVLGDVWVECAVFADDSESSVVLGDVFVECGVLADDSGSSEVCGFVLMSCVVFAE